MRLREMREDNDLTQKTLAAFLHIRQNTYSQYENGQRQVPVEVLMQLACFYNTSVDYLLNITDCKDPYPRSKAYNICKRKNMKTV